NRPRHRVTQPDGHESGWSRRGTASSAPTINRAPGRLLDRPEPDFLRIVRGVLAFSFSRRLRASSCGVVLVEETQKIRCHVAMLVLAVYPHHSGLVRDSPQFCFFWSRNRFAARLSTYGALQDRRFERDRPAAQGGR